jgi:heme exporter protein B
MFWILTGFFIRNYIRNANDLIQISLFYFISVSLAAYLAANSQDYEIFIHLSIWINLLLAHSLTLPTLFERDEESGFLDQLRIAPVSFESVILAKLLSHWVAMLLPLVALTPLWAIALPLQPNTLIELALSLSVGSLGLLAIGAVTAALVIGQRQRAAMLLVLMLPLYMPIIIFGMLSLSDDPAQASDAITCLIGIAILSLPISILATTTLLKN